jgi:nucleotide-binding universal stress UspA family protein
VKEQGAATPIVAGLVVVGVLLALLVADVARVTAARAQLTAAADASALAAAPATFARFGGSGSPQGEAAAMATANGAELVECRCEVDRSWSDRIVVVVVATDVDLVLLGDRRLRAAAAAEFRPVQLAESGD